MQSHPVREAPNYTMPFLVSAGVLLLIALVALWAIFGYLAALGAGFVANRLILRLPRRD